ncbi:MAG: hypothetical protein LBE85_07285, partial [Candidatus Accumulibacter sp.]|nr:hypothetical protein [Accumulibacter sp.]
MAFTFVLMDEVKLMFGKDGVVMGKGGFFFNGGRRLEGGKRALLGLTVWSGGGGVIGLTLALMLGGPQALAQESTPMAAQEEASPAAEATSGSETV